VGVFWAWLTKQVRQAITGETMNRLKGAAVLRCKSAVEPPKFAKSGCYAINSSFPMIGTETQQRCDIAGFVEFLIVFYVEQLQAVT